MKTIKTLGYTFLALALALVITGCNKCNGEKKCGGKCCGMKTASEQSADATKGDKKCGGKCRGMKTASEQPADAAKGDKKCGGKCCGMKTASEKPTEVTEKAAEAVVEKEQPAAPAEGQKPLDHPAH